MCLQNLFSVKVLTLFPEMFPGPLQYSLAGQALKKNIWSLEIINIRDFGMTRHRKVDDEPFGGGNGMIIRADVLGEALDHTLRKYPNSIILYPSPRGRTLNQQSIRDISQQREIIIVCGRFEGIDERIIEEYNVCEVSLGDFILSGGEIAALALLDSCIRLLPNVLANQEILSEESFNYYDQLGILLEYPQYTRPAIWRGRKVPEVLYGGNHQQVKKWRQDQAIRVTLDRRPDLLSNSKKNFGESNECN